MVEGRGLRHFSLKGTDCRPYPTSSILLTVKTICYCFSYTYADIAADVLQHGGQSPIMDRITEAKKNLTCQCDIKHPEKR